MRKQKNVLDNHPGLKYVLQTLFAKPKTFKQLMQYSPYSEQTLKKFIQYLERRNCIYLKPGRYAYYHPSYLGMRLLIQLEQA